MKLLPAFVGTPDVDQIYHMDALQLLAAMPDNSVDCVITSPPYDNLRTYNGYTFEFEPIARELFRVVKVGGVVVWVVGDATINGSETLTSMRQALYFVDVCGLKMHDTMIYEAAGTGAKGSNKSYWQGFEYMFVLAKGTPKTIHRITDVKNKTIGLIRLGRWGKNEKPHATKELGVRANIWRYNVGFMDGSTKTGHPAPFPELLARDHIVSWSNPGDLILDPFMGSGTTAVAAAKLGRHFIGCDISAEYVELARRRLQNADPFKPSVLTNNVTQLSLFEALS